MAIFNDTDISKSTREMAELLHQLHRKISVGFNQDGIANPDDLMRLLGSIKQQLNTLNTQTIVMSSFCQAIDEVLCTERSDVEAEVKDRMKRCLDKQIIDFTALFEKYKAEEAKPKIAGADGRILNK